MWKGKATGKRGGQREGEPWVGDGKMWQAHLEQSRRRYGGWGGALEADGQWVRGEALGGYRLIHARTQTHTWAGQLLYDKCFMQSLKSPGNEMKHPPPALSKRGLQGDSPHWKFSKQIWEAGGLGDRQETRPLLPGDTQMPGPHMFVGGMNK